MTNPNMGIDLQKSLGLAARSVSEELEKEGRRVRKVTLERTYATNVEDLWDAVTNRERLARFFAPVSGELQLGGRYQVEGNAGGTITECIPLKGFAATWEFGGGRSWIEVRFSPAGEDRARLTLTHYCPVDDHWEKFGPGAVGIGWDLALVGLEAHFTIEGFDREAGETLMLSDEGKRFMIDASEDWGRAALAGGEAPAQAQAAARRTAAFYTGEEVQEG